VPQSYSWAQEAQVDWCEAWIDLGDERTKVQVFAMRSMASGAAFHRAYLHATQQAFLEAHEHAFAYFGGVFHLLRYDNLASAVRKILRGYQREETVRFLAFRSHWRFAAEFCSPGEGHEKGGIEGEGGYFRRNHLVPVPHVADLDALNTMLLTACRALSAAQLRTLAEGDYVTKAEPVLLVGEAGTGKTHLATGLCVAACRQRRRVRFTTATALINELAEAAHAHQLSRALGRWEWLDLICIDELGYVPLAEAACELMFQVTADRAEKAAVIVTTNLPFSEWSQVIPNPRLCKALIDRLTDRAHIITTGSDPYRFRRTSAQRKGSKS
jgi:DNA replication protein DnaC